MAEIAAQSVLEVFKSQEVKPRIRIVRALRETLKEDVSIYTPTPLLSAFAAAARILRQEPTDKLGEKEIDLPADLGANTALYALSGIINSSIARSDELGAIPSFEPHQSNKTFWACSDADPLIAKASERMLDAVEGKSATAGGNIVVDEQNRPLIFTKSETDGERTGLTLVPVCVGGVDWPAGSIVKTYTSYSDVGPEFLAGAPSEAIEVLPVDKVRSLSLGRLSVFAFAKQERPHSFPYSLDTDSDGKNLMDSFQLDDIRAIAAQAARDAIHLGNIAA